MSARRALITGITGQDGSYLTELLLEKGYEVHGIARPSNRFHGSRWEYPHAPENEHPPRVLIHAGDLADARGLSDLVQAIEPDEIYNLAAQSHVSVSFDRPLYTADICALGTLRLLEAARQLAKRKHVRLYQASSSEMYGKVHEFPQRETTPFHPQSPYACAKVFSFYQTLNYREAHGLFACNGILFNHESPRRRESFVTRKITLGAARIREGLQDKLHLGNLDVKRDWGFAGDYVRAMWLMLQQDEPDDYVIATGENHSVREFLEATCAALDLRWQDHVEIDPRYLRPSEVDMVLGDATKAREKLGWVPQTSFPQLVQLMVTADWDLAKREAEARRCLRTAA